MGANREKPREVDVQPVAGASGGSGPFYANVPLRCIHRTADCLTLASAPTEYVSIREWCMSNVTDGAIAVDDGLHSRGGEMRRSYVSSVNNGRGRSDVGPTC